MELQTLIGAIPGNIAQGLIWAVMALGVYLTFRVLNIADLTVDGSFATGGAVAVILISSGSSVPVAMVAATAAGLLAGLVTGLLHTALGIPDILAGILSQIGLYSINLRIMGGKANVGLGAGKYHLMVSIRQVNPSILISLLFVAVIIALTYWFLGTQMGSALRATGNNSSMSRAQGINIHFMKVLGLILSNGLVALSGGLFAQYQGFADVNMGRGSIVIGLAAVIIGEVLASAILGRRLNFVIRLVFVVLGAIIYYIVIGLVLWLKMPTNDLKLFTAMIVAVFLAVPYLRGKATSSFAKAARKGGRRA